MALVAGAEESKSATEFKAESEAGPLVAPEEKSAKVVFSETAEELTAAT